ncbi:MAG TPA: hypothetical protein VIP11_17505 [Gemmatimonadaceae bacterium]
MGRTHWLIGLAFAPTALFAQAAKAPPPPAVAPLTEAQQIASSVLALPTEFRSNARILGYRSGSTKLVPLREGSGPFTCLATEPNQPMHLACYHNSMEPFMARGRALREEGVKGPQVDTVRFAEVKSGKLPMPTQPAALYQLFGGTYDPATNALTGAQPLFVIYISGATAASTGLPDKPAAQGSPWIMFPGTPKAHIMLTPKM